MEEFSSEKRGKSPNSPSSVSDLCRKIGVILLWRPTFRRCRAVWHLKKYLFNENIVLKGVGVWKSECSILYWVHRGRCREYPGFFWKSLLHNLFWISFRKMTVLIFKKKVFDFPLPQDTPWVIHLLLSNFSGCRVKIL